MTELKFYLLCFLIAAPQDGLGSAAEEFVEKWVDGYNFNFNAEKVESISGLDSEECFSEAVNRGAQVLLYSSDCYLWYLTGSACFKEEGQLKVYVRKDLVTDGSPDDSAQVLLYSIGCYLWYLTGSACFKEEGQLKGYVRKDLVTDGSPDDSVEKYINRYFDNVPALRYYRIESPTILEFGDIRNRGPVNKFQYFMTTLDGYELAFSHTPAFVDPSCHTTSTCSYVFMTTAPEIPESDILVLYDICGQSIQVDSGRSIYVLSHEGIGCKNFPNDYPVADCWAEFTAAGEITINVTFVNFRESDQCDGFTMTAVTDDANGSSATTDLCDATAPTELTSAGGKVRIEFGGSASPTREKYGFDIQVTTA